MARKHLSSARLEGRAVRSPLRIRSPMRASGGALLIGALVSAGLQLGLLLVLPTVKRPLSSAPGEREIALWLIELEDEPLPSGPPDSAPRSHTTVRVPSTAPPERTTPPKLLQALPQVPPGLPPTAARAARTPAAEVDGRATAPAPNIVAERRAGPSIEAVVVPEVIGHTPRVDGADLDPARVAAAQFAQGLRGDTALAGTASAPADLSPGTRAVELDEYLHAVAAAKEHLRTRAAPKLRAQADGTYLWYGPVFTARILCDGSVAFIDEADLVVDGLSIGGLKLKRRRPTAYAGSKTAAEGSLRVGDVEVEPLQAPQVIDRQAATLDAVARTLVGFVPLIGFFGHFDLDAAIKKARDDDPYGHERHVFLEQTAVFRRELRERHGNQCRGAR